jgi:hypothetical protein
VYKHKEVEERVGQMSPVLRGLVEEMLRRGEQLDYRAPLDEVLDRDLEAQLRLVLSEPALRREWEEFWQAYIEAADEDAAAAEADVVRAEGFIKLIERAKELDQRDGRPVNEHMTLEEAVSKLEAAGELNALEREYLISVMDELVLVENPEEDEG